MGEDNDFWALRDCILPPVPELALAADYMSLAADALLAGNQDAAREHLLSANIPGVRAWAQRIMGSWEDAVHRRRPIERPVPAERVKQRMPGAAEKQALFARDGWRCRYCGTRVFHRGIRKLMEPLCPADPCWAANDTLLHAAFLALAASLDHVKPHSLGGDNSAGNLVTTCQPCNYGHMDESIEFLGLKDPRVRPPIVDGWDGLCRLLHSRPATSAAPATSSTKRPRPPMAPPPSASSVAGWIAETTWDRDEREGLSAFAAELTAAGIEWRSGSVLVGRIQGAAGICDIFGIAPTGAVHLPWYLTLPDDAGRRIAEMIAATISGAAVRKRRVWWLVEVGDRKATVRELIGASSALAAAVTEIRQWLGRPSFRRGSAS